MVVVGVISSEFFRRFLTQCEEANSIAFLFYTRPPRVAQGIRLCFVNHQTKSLPQREGLPAIMRATDQQRGLALGRLGRLYPLIGKSPGQGCRQGVERAAAAGDQNVGHDLHVPVRQDCRNVDHQRA